MYLAREGHCWTLPKGSETALPLWNKLIATKAVAELHSHGFIHKVGAAGDCLLLVRQYDH